MGSFSVPSWIVCGFLLSVAMLYGGLWLFADVYTYIHFKIAAGITTNG